MFACHNEHCKSEQYTTKPGYLCESCLNSLAEYFAGEHKYCLHAVAMRPPHWFSQQTDGVLPEEQAWDMKLAAMKLCDGPLRETPKRKWLENLKALFLGGLSIALISFCGWAVMLLISMREVR